MNLRVCHGAGTGELNFSTPEQLRWVAQRDGGHLGQDAKESLGFVIAAFVAAHPGAGLDLGVNTGEPAVEPWTGGPFVLSPTVVPGGGSLMLVTNVPPGPLTPAPFAPADITCRMKTDGLDYVMAPKTVMRLHVTCGPAALSP